MAITEPIRQSVVVANPNGLHMRPATRFAQAARKFRAKIEVIHEDKRADGKSAMELVFLIAMPGAELWIEVDGDDAEIAVEALLGLLADPGGDEH